MHPCRGERRFALPSHPDLNKHPPLEGNDIGTACRAPTRSQRLVSHALCLRCASPQPFVRHAPTLGGECYPSPQRRVPDPELQPFQWAPTLGGECYDTWSYRDEPFQSFQWAPTLGGECYWRAIGDALRIIAPFQWAPTLGGECYTNINTHTERYKQTKCFNGHPPLGVNATSTITSGIDWSDVAKRFQWAPTLGGECYTTKHSRNNRHQRVSMSTHPWG